MHLLLRWVNRFDLLDDAAPESKRLELHLRQDYRHQQVCKSNCNVHAVLGEKQMVWM